MSQKELSVIVPVCERADEIQLVHQDYINALNEIGMEWELIYLFNASTEDAFDTEKSALCTHPNVEAILLTRNFGEGTAIQVGVEQATGEWILTLPPYPQIETSELHKMFDAIDDQDMIITKRWPRVDSKLNQQMTKMFNGALAKLSNVSYKDLGCSVRLFKKSLMNDMTIYGDQHRFLPVIAYEYGAAIEEIEIAQAKADAPKRFYSLSVYVRRFLDLLSVVFITKFNKKPLRFFGMLGAGCTVLGLLALSLVTLQRWVWEIPAGDRPFLLISVLLIALGVQLVAIGLVGETIIFTHAKDLKEYRIKKIVN